MDVPRRISCSREALVLALSVPFLCLHDRYNPDISVSVGSTSVKLSLSDLAMVAILVAALHASRRLGTEPLRRGGWTLALAAAFVGLVIIATLAGPILSDGYPLGASLVSAAKFAEYALLAAAVPLIVRHRSDALAIAVSLTSVGAAAALVGVLQIAGLVGNLDNVPAGRRMPSFVGYHDFAALAGVTLAIAIAVIATGAWSRLRSLGVVAAVAGVIGVVIAGAMATVLAVVLGGVLAFVTMAARQTLSVRRLLAVGGLLLAVTAGSLSLRSGDVANFVGFLGETRARDENIQTYSQRTVLAYIGLRIFVTHPLTGVGWQASELPVNFEPHLDDARRRFPEVAEQALPSEDRRWGVQNAYVQAAADMGLIGLAVVLAMLASAFLSAAVRSVRGDAPPGPRALAVSIAILVCAAEWAALGLVPGVPATALLWLAVGGAVALPRGRELPYDNDQISHA